MKKTKYTTIPCNIPDETYAHLKEVAKWTKLTVNKVITVFLVSQILLDPDSLKKEKKS